MAVEIVMPNLGFDTQSGRLIEWLKQPGDPVNAGEVLAVVESDKSNVELESIATGTLLEVLAAPGADVPVGAVIARVGSASERQAEAQPAAPAASTPPTSSAAPATPADASPLARRLAEEHGIDLARISGSGPGGRIMRSDIEAALASRPAPSAADAGPLALPRVRKAARAAGVPLDGISPTGAHGQITIDDLQRHLAAAAASATATPAPASAPPPQPAAAEGVREIPLSRARRIIGERLGKSMREAPHFYVSGEFDVDAAMRALPGRIRINDLLQYLAVQALLRVPALNATFHGDQLHQYEHVHLGIAVGLEDALMTPVLRSAERYSLQGLAEESRALIERTRSGRLRADDLQGGTFTVSNLGVVRQVERFTAVINPPQVAILAIGAVRQRPVVIAGGLHVRHTVFLTLSGDHRAVDGMHLARYMAAFQEQLDQFST